MVAHLINIEEVYFWRKYQKFPFCCGEPVKPCRYSVKMLSKEYNNTELRAPKWRENLRSVRYAMLDEELSQGANVPREEKLEN